MTEYERSCLKTVNAVLARQLPEEISNMLIGKGLTLVQAEALLARAKDLLRLAVI